jgi:phosphoribosylanthranilate isomerase
MTRIKVSGLRDPGDAERAGALGADMVACVFFARSPRYVNQAEAWAIRRALPPGVQLAGIFVDAPAPLVRIIADSCQLDWIQLFGAEPRSEVELLAPRAFKTVVVHEPGGCEQAARDFLGRRPRRHPAEGPALQLHLAESAATAWAATAPVAARAPIVVSGPSLDAARVGEAIRQAQPWAVDVWDAVEREPGRLDPERFEAFVAAVRAASP